MSLTLAGSSLGYQKARRLLLRDEALSQLAAQCFEGDVRPERCRARWSLSRTFLAAEYDVNRCAFF